MPLSFANQDANSSAIELGTRLNFRPLGAQENNSEPGPAHAINEPHPFRVSVGDGNAYRERVGHCLILGLVRCQYRTLAYQEKLRQSPQSKGDTQGGHLVGGAARWRRGKRGSLRVMDMRSSNPWWPTQFVAATVRARLAHVGLTARRDRPSGAPPGFGWRVARHDPLPVSL
jgi:hypothetical protein